MRRAFTPAIKLLNRLAYTKKFMLLWLLSMAAIAVVVYHLFVSLNRVIQPSQRQLEGLVLIEPISRTVQSLQLHRGLSAILLSGEETLRDRRAAQEGNVTAELRALEQKLPEPLTAAEELRLVKAAWEQLRREGLGLTVAGNIAAHTQLIEQLHSFEVLVADEYLLTLDPELPSFYLIDTMVNKLPHALEHLGQIRANGTSILTQKQLTETQQADLKVMIAETGTALKSLNHNLERAVRYNPSIQKPLQSISSHINRSSDEIINLVIRDIFVGNFTSASPEAFLQIATMEIDKAYAQMYDAILPAAESLIRARISRARSALYTSTGIALLAFLLVVYLSVSIYYTIVGNVQSLARSARAFAKGDLSTRIRLDTSDELSQVADSFNEMADGFNAMLEARKQAESLLAKESHKNETLLRTASDGIHILDLEGNVVQVNDAFCRMLGYTKPELLNMNVTQWDARLTAEQIQANIAAMGDRAITLETQHRRRDGSLVDVEVSTVKVEVDGSPLIYSSSRDVTQRKLAERALVESQEKLHSVIDTALDAVVQMDAGGLITGWNRQAEKIFGWTAREAVGRRLDETIIPPQYRDAHRHGLERFLLTGEKNVLNARVQLTGLRRDGHEFPVELSITAINTRGGYEFNGFLRDITQQKESEELIWSQANFDTLTGLPNRRMFHDRLAQEIKKANRTELKVALLFLDLDKFKEVNDTLGHSVGDRLLQETARRITGCVRETDTVARLGGDEFTVILAELDDTGSIERVAENIRQRLAEPFPLGDEVVHISGSIGITLYPVDATEMEDLIKNADQAMYAAKDKGHNRFEYFTPSMQQAAQARLRMTNELRTALSTGQFCIHYQPIVELATGHIHKAEALIRWQHPERGMVNPAQFIPLAEETGMIVEIGDWVFRETAQHLKRWRALHAPELQVSVNVSPTQFRQTGNICETWLDYLQGIGLPGQCIAIEITEGLLLEAEHQVTSNLERFRNAGVHISVDDFGTGYSSLSYLKKFDIDYLKIDRSFVRDLATDPDDLALSEAIIVMAHKLGLKVIAEGVETEKQRKLLASAGCDYAQGYLFSKPLPLEEFEKLLTQQLSGGYHYHI